MGGVTRKEVERESELPSTSIMELDTDISGRGVLNKGMGKGGFLPSTKESDRRIGGIAMPRFTGGRIEWRGRRRKRWGLNPRGSAKKEEVIRIRDRMKGEVGEGGGDRSFEEKVVNPRCVRSSACKRGLLECGRLEVR